MRFRRLMAASMAGVMAVSSAIVCQISASAAAPLGTATKAEKFSQQNLFGTGGEIPTITKIVYNVTLGGTTSDGSNGKFFFNVGGGSNPEKTYGLPGATKDDGTNYDVSLTPGTATEVVLEVASGDANKVNQYWYQVEAEAFWGADLTINYISAYAGSTLVGQLPDQTALFDGTQLLLKKNQTYNYQGLEEFSADGFTASTLEDVANSGELTAEFQVNGAQVGTTEFDVTNIQYQIAIGCHDASNDYPWITCGTSTYDPATKKVTVTADIAEAVKSYDFASKGKSAADYSFDTFKLVAMVDLDKASDTVKMYHEDITATVASGEVAVESVTLDKETATIQKGKTLTLNATVKPDDADDPTVTWTSSKTDVATVDSDGVVTAVAEGTAIITAKAGEKSATCTVTVDKTDAELIAAAKTAAETELGGFSATNSTTPDNIGTVVSSAVLNINNDIEVTVNDADFQITKATEEAAGSITGKVTLKKGTETAEVTVSLEIAKLPVDDASRVAAAKTATEKVLSGITATNDTKEADVLAKITEAISDTKATAAITGFKVTPATSAAAGSVTGTVTLTSGTKSDTVAINLPIAQLEKTDAEKLADAKKVAQTAVAGAAKAEDITEAAIKTAVNNADVAVKVESKVTKEATTTAEGETTVTVTLTVGTETDTVTRTFPIEKLTEEKPVTSDALWEGSVALGNWANSVQISGKDFTNFGAGTFVIELAPETGAQVALKYTATDWPVVPGCEEWYDVSGTKFEIEVTAEAMKAVGTNTLIVGGKNATIKKVTFVPAKTEAPEPDTTVEIDTSTTPVTKIESVDTKTDASGKVTEQIAYCAISEADAKNYDSYIVTITRGKDSKKFTQVIEDCFKAVQYESKDGKTVQVNAKDGSYCVLLDITGIGSDFGGITVTIAPNA